MFKSKTHEEFVNEVKELTNDDYQVLGRYSGSKTKLLMKHKKCGFEYEVKPNVFLSGSRCPKCAGKLRKTPEYFRNEVYELVGDEYDVLTDYTRKGDKLLFRHNKCKHEFMMTPHNFLAGQRCPQCFGTPKKSQEQVEKEIYRLVGDQYILLSEYKSGKEKIALFHQDCQKIYYPTLSDFSRGYRCIHCYGNAKYTQEDFEKRVFDLYGDEYTVVGKYINFSTKIEIRHNICRNTWLVNPSDFLSQKSHCPSCIPYSHGEKSISNFLNSNNISHSRHKTYPGLLGVNNGLLSYDFHLPDYNILIEFNGKQHEEPVDLFGGIPKFKQQQEHDRRKRKYAKEHNMDLLEIWYYDYKNIDQILYDTIGRGDTYSSKITTETNMCCLQRGKTI